MNSQDQDQVKWIYRKLNSLQQQVAMFTSPQPTAVFPTWARVLVASSVNLPILSLVTQIKLKSKLVNFSEAVLAVKKE